MPTYDYKCKDCGHQFEEFQKIDVKPLEICPVCNGKVQRLITGGTGLIFKGSGFYITDYKDNKKDGNKSESKKPADKTSKSKNGDSKSSDNKSSKTTESSTTSKSTKD